MSVINIELGRGVSVSATIGFNVRCFHILEGDADDNVETAASDIISVVVDVELGIVVSSKVDGVDVREGFDTTDVDIGAVVGGIVSSVVVVVNAGVEFVDVIINVDSKRFDSDVTGDNEIGVVPVEGIFLL